MLIQIKKILKDIILELKDNYGKSNDKYHKDYRRLSSIASRNNSELASLFP